MSRFNLVFVFSVLLGWYSFIRSRWNQENIVEPTGHPRNNGPLPPKLIYPAGSFVRRIVAVGDLHGDFGHARKVLKMAEVIDAHDEWSGDVDLFVQTGDIVDR